MPAPFLTGLLLSVAVVMGFLGAAFVIRIAQGQRLMDQPGKRRSHDTPTPRGGGVGIALIIVLTPWLAHNLQLIHLIDALGVSVGALTIAVCGAWDDHRPLGPVAKLIFQVLATAVLLLCLHLSGSGADLWPLSLGLPGYLLAGVAVIWLTNLFNFMDGSDGLAATQAIVTLSALGLAGLFSGQWLVSLVCAPVAAAALGFLPLNLPPARVFMGDVGSLSLGWICAVAALNFTSSSTIAIPVILLFGLFFFDATLTLIHRMRSGRQWYTAHREHAYQALLRSGWTHRRLLLLAVLLNGLLYVPAAWLAWRLIGPQWIWLMLVGALSIAYWVLARRQFLKVRGRL